MLRNFSEKLRRSKISQEYTWLLRGKNFRLDDAFVGILELEVSLLVGRQLQQKDTKRRRRKGKKKLKKPKS